MRQKLGMLGTLGRRQGSALQVVLPSELGQVLRQVVRVMGLLGCLHLIEYQVSD